MFKVKQKITKILVACLTALFAVVLAVGGIFAMPNTTVNAAEETKTLSIFGKTGTKASDSSSISWTDGVVTFTNYKASSSTAIRTTDSDHYRVYAKSVVEISVSEGNITKIVITCASSGTYANVCQTSATNAGATAAVSGAVVTITPSTEANSFTFTITAQTRFKTVAVTYEVDSASGCAHDYESVVTAPTCEANGYTTHTCKLCAESYTSDPVAATGHAYVENVTQEATCTAVGSKTVTCSRCDFNETVEIPVIPHNYVDDSCSVCGAELPLEATLTFDDAAKRTVSTTTQQVWNENGIVLTYDKNNYNQNLAEYAKPVRFYSGTKITIISSAKIAKIEFVANNSSYATALESSIGATATATVNDTKVTVTFSNPVESFAIVLNAQVRLDSLTVTHVANIVTDCEHTNQTTTTTDATCTNTGSTVVTCDDCGKEISNEEIPALGHNYVDNFCERCSEQDPATINYEGYYYFSYTHNETVYYVNNSELNNNRYIPMTDVSFTEAIDLAYVFRLEKTGTSVYALYDLARGCYQENVTVEKVDSFYRFYATIGTDECQFLLNAGSTNKYVKFYKKSNATQSNYAQDITLTPVDLSAHIDSATIAIGESLTLNYYVTMSETFAEAKMTFTMMGESSEPVAGELQESGDFAGKYKFSFVVGPHQMAENISAELVFNNVTIASKAEYSIATYAQNKLNDENSSNELKQLISDMLYYGDAAYNYINGTTGTPVTDAVANELTASNNEPTSTDFSLTSATLPEGESYGAWFTGATVYFSDVNKIVVKLSTTENVKLTVNGVAVEVTSTAVYTDAILATGFAETYTFVLYYNNVEMQTLTYSVNTYAYKMKDNAEMSELALALYRYGVSAKAYIG